MAPYYPYSSLSVAATSPRTSHLSSSTNSPNSSRPCSPASNNGRPLPNQDKAHNDLDTGGGQPGVSNEDPVAVIPPVLQLLRLCDLEKYADNLSGYSFEQVRTRIGHVGRR